MAKHDADINLRVDLTEGDVTSTISKLQSRFNKLSKLDFGKSLSKGFAQVLKDMKEAGNRANVVMQELKKLETVRPTTLYSNLSKELSDLTNKQDDLNDKFRESKATSLGLKDRLQIIREEIAAKNAQIKQENELNRLKNEGRQKSKQIPEKPLIDYKQLNEYKDALQQYEQTNTQAANYQKALAAVESKIDAVTSKMQAMEDAGTHVFDGVGTVQYQMYMDELRDLSDELTKYVNIVEYASEMPGFTPDTATSKWQSFMAVLSETHPMLATIGEEIVAVPQRLATNLGLMASDIKRKMGDALKSIPQLAAQAAAGLGRLVGKGVIAGLHAIAKGAKIAAINLANMAKNLAKSVAGGIISKLKALGSAITGVGKKTSSSNNAFKAGFMTLLRYGLGIRSVYFLFRRLRKALGEGIGNLAQYSPAFNTVISNFMSALTQLKNSFATAFAPIINVVAPILTFFINLVSEAVTKVGMLIAAITGQKSFIRAKSVQTDFAASLDKTSKSTDKANKSAEKYKRTLAGFDDVEILKNPDSGSGSGGSGGGGGGGGGTSPSDMFETVAIPSAFEDWAEKIKDAWAKADFTELGQILGEKIADALDKIPWDTIKSYAGRFGKSFATFINGLLSTDSEGNSHLAQAIGRTIGEAINTVFTFANAFVTNIDPKLVGNFFADLINRGVETIDWKLIADTLSKGINNIFSALNTFANKLDASNLGTQIQKTISDTLNGLDWNIIHGSVVSMATRLAEFVNSVFTPGVFGSLGATIGKALTSAVNGIRVFAINWDATNFGNAIATGINNFFKNFNFESAGVTFGTLITKVGTALTNAINDVKWQNIGADLTNFILSIPWKDIWGTTSQLTAAIAGALGEAFGGIAKAIFENIQKAINNYFKAHDGETGLQIALGIVEEIGKFFLNVATWPVKYIVNPFIDGLKSAFGIHSPASDPELLEAARNIGLGILEGIAKPFTNIVDWVKEHILDPITTALKDPAEKIKELLPGKGGDSSGAISVGVKLIKSGWDSIADFVGTAVSVGIKLWKNGWESIAGYIGTAVSVGVKLWRHGWESIAGFVGTAVSVAVRLWKYGWSSIAGFVGTAVSVAVKLWRHGWKSIAGFVGTAVSVGVKLWRHGWKSISSFVGTHVSVGISLVKKGASWLWKLIHKSKGGAFYGGSWHGIPQYASGGAPNRGTMFVAGENGAEAVGHINGRTEVLNQSQMAAVMYNAVLNGTAQLTKIITSHMTVCTNTVIGNINNLLVMINFTSSQIYDINKILTNINVSLTDIVSGKVIPTRTYGDNTDLMRALNTIIQNQNNVVTRSELQELLTTMFRDYMNIDFYLSDEQVARHANAGNVRLNRRYGLV